jgi:hypothetical protein
MRLHWGRVAFNTIAMPLGLAFGYAMVVLYFLDRPPYEYYSYAGNLGRALGILNCSNQQVKKKIGSEVTVKAESVPNKF